MVYPPISHLVIRCMTVDYGSFFRFVKPMADKSVSPGETAVLECLSSGSPRPRLTWRKDGGELVATERHFFTADSQLLIIVKAREEDAGR